MAKTIKTQAVDDLFEAITNSELVKGKVLDIILNAFNNNKKNKGKGKAKGKAKMKDNKKKKNCNII